MAIKFPDFQVLMSRADQVPRVQREGDATMAGKLAPGVQQQMAEQQKKVTHSPESRDVRKHRDEDKQKKPRRGSRRRRRDNGLDVRA